MKFCYNYCSCLKNCPKLNSKLKRQFRFILFPAPLWHQYRTNCSHDAAQSCSSLPPGIPGLCRIQAKAWLSNKRESSSLTKQLKKIKQAHTRRHCNQGAKEDENFFPLLEAGRLWRTVSDGVAVSQLVHRQRPPVPLLQLIVLGAYQITLLHRGIIPHCIKFSPFWRCLWSKPRRQPKYRSFWRPRACMPSGAPRHPIKSPSKPCHGSVRVETQFHHHQIASCSTGQIIGRNWHQKVP